MLKTSYYFFICFFILICLLAGGLYSVSSTLSDKDIKSFIISKVESALPGSRVQISHLDYTVGLSLRFKIHDFDIKLKSDKPGSELFFAEKFFVKIPLWRLIFKTNWKEMDIIAWRPKINYYEYRNGLSNWGAVAKSFKNNKDVTKITSEIVSLKLSSDHAVFFYQTRDDYRGEISIDNLLLNIDPQKDGNLFSLRGRFEFWKNSKKTFSSDISLSGKSLDRFLLGNKKPSTDLKIDLINNKGSYPFITIPDFKGGASLQKKRGGLLVGKLSLHGENVADSIKANISLSNKIRVDHIDIYLKWDSLFKNNDYLGVRQSLEHSTLRISGRASGFLHPYLNLKFRLVDPIEIERMKGFMDLFLEGHFIGDRAFLRFLVKTDNGQAGVTFKATFSDASLIHGEPLMVKATLRKIKISEKELNFLSRIFHEACAGRRNNLSVLLHKIKMPKSEITLTGQEISLGKTVYNFKGQLILREENILTDNFEASTGGGEIKLKLFSKIFPRKMVFDFTTSARRFPLSKISALLPPPFKGSRGLARAQLSGMLGCEEDSIAYDFKFKGAAFRGDLKGFDMRRFLMQKVPQSSYQSKIKKIKFTSRFKKLVLEGVFKNDRHRINKLEFLGSSRGLSLKGQGTLFPLREKKRGGVVLRVRDKRGVIRKHLGFSRRLYDYAKHSFAK